MTEFENQSNVERSGWAENPVLDQPVVLSPETKKSWLDYLLFWRRRALLPNVRKEILPAKRINHLPAVLLGALLVLAITRTDLSYWNAVVNTGIKIVAVPVETVNFTYTYLTKPLNHVLGRVGYFVKKVENKNFALVFVNWGQSVQLGYDRVVGVLARSENRLIGGLEKVSQNLSLALIQKSNDLAMDIDTVKERNIYRPIRLVKEKTVVRRQLLQARAIAMLDKKTVNGLEFFSDVEKGVAKVRAEARALPPQTAALWSSAVLGNLEKTENTLRQVYERWSIKFAKWSMVLDDTLLWLENLPVHLNQKVSAVWTASLLKVDEVATNWHNFMNPSEISPEALEEIKKAVAEEIAKSLQGQVRPSNTDTKKASYGAVVVPSTGDPSADEKIKKDLENQFSDEVSISFDKSGQAGIVTPIFEGGKKGDDYVFLLTPINQ